jgi:hypothetical protein
MRAGPQKAKERENDALSVSSPLIERMVISVLGFVAIGTCSKSQSTLIGCGFSSASFLQPMVKRQGESKIRAEKGRS